MIGVFPSVKQYDIRKFQKKRMYFNKNKYVFMLVLGVTYCSQCTRNRVDKH